MLLLAVSWAAASSEDFSSGFGICDLERLRSHFGIILSNRFVVGAGVAVGLGDDSGAAAGSGATGAYSGLRGTSSGRLPPFHLPLLDHAQKAVIHPLRSSCPHTSSHRYMMWLQNVVSGSPSNAVMNRRRMGRSISAQMAGSLPRS